ncbi:MAG: hypothetical protein A3F67_03330 [Verrucomicrobia bacterium RIFCSPHIGHO2_12_FULL_41_10]|nr:MAG: hypothetical protein A3F67_03330 [Verrucomicrobia bacterium RIFCSPHIGHO2_12_FULL_41_10]HLB34840.1 Gfo/Idh/MocA family oxidoreductase [Chthoniobacterales bacterium]
MKIVNIIGAGLIGQERMKAVAKLQASGIPIKVGWVYDPYQQKLNILSVEHGFKTTEDINRFYDQPADLVVVSCPHDIATDHTCNALQAGHCVLIEKPIGRNYLETQRIAEAAGIEKRLFVGLNYRFMPGVATLIEDWHGGQFGKPISLSMQIGHGGKPGDEKTWKLDPIRCGGGALLDPGIHMLDLCRLMTGSNLTIQAVTSWSGFWKTGIEEEVRLLLQNGDVAIALEVSVVRWRSHFEIFAQGTEGYGIVTGRGRSYGIQRYRRGKRWGWQYAKDQAASEEVVLEDSCENSFADELAACLNLKGINSARPADLKDGLGLMELYQDIKARL